MRALRSAPSCGVSLLDIEPRPCRHRTPTLPRTPP